MLEERSLSHKTKMPMSEDFKKVYARFTKQYGEKEGKERYYAWLNKKGLDDTKSYPKGKEKKERQCIVHGVEIKEIGDTFHVEGLIATTHIDSLDEMEGIDIPDRVLKETLESFANQINSTEEARRMGVHHSEGRPTNAEYFGVADIQNKPAQVINLSDGEWGLYVDTALLKNDPETPHIIDQFKNGDLDSFSITYDTQGFLTTDFVWEDDKLVRHILPDTKLWGYTAANDPVNRNAVATGYGFKEFKEMIKKDMEADTMKSDKPEKKEGEETAENPPDATPKEKTKPDVAEESPEVAKEETPSNGDEAEVKEFLAYKRQKKSLEEKERVKQMAGQVAEAVIERMEVKEKVLKDPKKATEREEVLEVKEYAEAIEKNACETKELANLAARVADKINLDWQSATTGPVEKREFKQFRIAKNKLEMKGLGVTTNQNSDTDYLQSTAELQDVYDPVIYSALNEQTVFWNVLRKDDYSGKGNNKVQFVLKTGANATAAFYTGNSVSTGNTERLKFETKFKKAQVGVSVDGDMIAAARGGPVSDVFAQEVVDATQTLLAVVNAALFAEVGLETASAVIGLEYITDSAGNTSLYNLTRSATNKLAPAAAGDTYINQASANISVANLRKGVRQAVEEGAMKSNLIWVTSPLQADKLRAKFDDQRRLLNPTDTVFGFTTDLFPDGIPVFEDKDCNDDDWFLVDLDTHRVGIWIPPTLEKLGKTADSEDAFIKMYFCTYNRAPRRMVQIYGCNT